jgi:DNA-binding Xre family transcriptional regulator
MVRGDNMAVCYKKLWKMLIDKDMIKKDLRLQTGFSTTTMSKLSKDENVSMDVLEKICSVLNCDVGDIMEFVPDKKEES